LSRKLVQGVWNHPLATLVVLLLLAVTGLAGAKAGRHVWAEYHYREAQRSLERREFDRARDHLARCLLAWPYSAEVPSLAAGPARRAGAYDDAKRYLKECQRLGGVAEALDLEKGLLRAQQGALAGLEGQLLSFVEQGHPDSVLILEALARGCLKTYSLPRAKHCLELWLEREPDNVQALLWRARGHRRRF